MKKGLLLIFSLLALSAPSMVRAASWTMSVANDTVYATVDSSAIVTDMVVVSSGSVTLNWHVTSATTFPNDWLTQAAFGICDNNVCVNNTGGTYIWDNSAKTGTTFTTLPYSASSSDFHLALNLKGCTPGTHMVTVTLVDGSLNSKTVTFIITKPVPTSVPNVTASESAITMYPNPATNDLNVIYDANAGVKNIAIYNIIGKVMNVYKVTDNTSANLNIENMPSGIYFVKLYNANGTAVATRKFTKQ